MFPLDTSLRQSLPPIPWAEQARAAARPVVANFLGVHGPSKITSCAGLPEELATEFKRRKTRKIDATELVTDEVLDMFAVAGDPAMCAARLNRFVSGGFETVIIRTLPELPLDQTFNGLASARAALSPADNDQS